MGHYIWLFTVVGLLGLLVRRPDVFVTAAATVQGIVRGAFAVAR